MKAIVIVYSYHHLNTKKIADCMAGELHCDVMTPGEAEGVNLEDYDLIGLGAGIDSGHHYKQMLDYAQSLTFSKDKKCFIFSTSAIINDKKIKSDHDDLRRIMLGKGYNVVGEFACKGFNTNSFLKFFGGMNKQHPNVEDMENAKQFVNGLIE